MRKVVVNSSPLIALSGIKSLELLREIYGKILIPQAVYREISAKPGSVCQKSVDAALSWIEICAVENRLAKLFFKSKLHEGEVEAMILTQEKAADLLIIDDALAKKHAEYLGMNVTGTLGVLVKAKKQGIIPELNPLLEKLIGNHIYISDNLIKKCLLAVGE